MGCGASILCVEGMQHEILCEKNSVSSEIEVKNVEVKNVYIASLCLVKQVLVTVSGIHLCKQCVCGGRGGGERDVAGLNIHNLIIHTKFPDFLVC